MPPIKVVYLGDACCGKSRLLGKIINGNVAWDIQDNLDGFFTVEEITRHIKGKTLSLALLDTPGQEEFVPALRQHYPGTGVFVICFAINRCSEADKSRCAVTLWIKEILEYAPSDTPFIIVGCQKDLADDTTLEIAKEWGAFGVQDLGATSYVECSAFTGEGVQTVLEAVAEAYEASRNKIVSEDIPTSRSIRESIKRLVQR